MKKIYYFTSPTCGPCQFLAPKMEEVKTKYGVPIEKIDVTQNPIVAASFKVKAVPTLILVNNETEIDRVVGGTLSISSILNFYNNG